MSYSVLRAPTKNPLRVALTIVIAAFLTAAPIAAPIVAQAQSSAAESFVAELGDSAVQLLEDESLTAETAEARFRELFQSGFDIPTIARFALGTYWRVATDDEKETYLSLFEDLVVITYARRFEEYSGEELVVRGSRPEGQRDIMVLSDIIRPDGPPVAVGWRVREQEAGLRIIDVVIEGVSQGITQRDEFRSIIQRNGGELNALFDIMRDNIANSG